MPPDLLPTDMAQLARLQGWMQHAMLAASPDGASTHVRSDTRLSAADRIAIYARSYRQRLVECLRTEYPVLAALAGPTAFDLFAQGYIAAHPSQSYTLYDFGSRFADYLERVRPSGPEDAIEAIPAALARIERAKAEVLRARGIEHASIPSPAALDPIITTMLGLRACWRPDSVRLLALAFDFTETLDAAARHEAPTLPRREATLIAVARTRYRIECHRLEEWQYTWLAELPTSSDAEPATLNTDPRIAAWLPSALRLGLSTAQCA